MDGKFEAKKMLDTLKGMANVGKKFARQALREGAKVQANALKGNAPRASGKLASAIKVRAMKRSSLKIGVIAQLPIVRQPTYYGSFLELGSKKMKARHWMKATFISTIAASQQRIKTVLSELISSYKGELLNDGD